MVYSIICHFHFGCTRFRASDLWLPNRLWWPSNSCMGLVHRFSHGNVHRQLSRRTRFCVPHSRWDVLCHEACCPQRTCRNMGLDNRMGQFSGTSWRSCKSCVHDCADDLRCSCYEFATSRWRVCVLTVRPCTGLISNHGKLTWPKALHGRMSYLRS